MTIKQQFKRKGPKCHQCGKFGHTKKTCRSFSTEANDKRKNRDSKQKANAGQSILHKSHLALNFPSWVVCSIQGNNCNCL